MGDAVQSTRPGLLESLNAGDRRALARAITVLENDLPAAAALRNSLRKEPMKALRVGFTGAPGVGKSSLISAYVRQLRGAGSSVAVVSVDPSSPLGGGAILGDRLRMGEHVNDSGVFIRSVAARGHLGGLSRSIGDTVRAVDLCGFDVIILETVGTGQSEVEVAGFVDVCIVVTCPGMGDEIQAMKAGVLDIADVLVVNKADQPDAARTTGALKAMLKLRAAERRDVPVIETVATEGSGIDSLARAIEFRGRNKA